MRLTIVDGVKGLHEAAVDFQVHSLHVRVRRWNAHEGRNDLPPKVLVHQARAGQLGGKACGCTIQCSEVSAPRAAGAVHMLQV